MSGQKQKRPYRRKLESVNVTAEVYADPKDAAERINAIPGPNEAKPITDEQIASVAARIASSPVFVHSLQTTTRTERSRETLDISVVYRVEAAIGRTSNAWGMVDPLELIQAVDRVLRGGEG